MANGQSPALMALLSRIDRGELTDSDFPTLSRLVRAASEGRSITEIVEADRRDRRDKLLVAMRQRFFADLSRSGAAKKIAKFLQSYAAGAWRVDRSQATPPEEGTMNRAGFEILLLGQAVSWKTVDSALQRYPLSAANESAAKGTL
jgi:hypothetical protein